MLFKFEKKKSRRQLTAAWGSHSVRAQTQKLRCYKYEKNQYIFITKLLWDCSSVFCAGFMHSCICLSSHWAESASSCPCSGLDVWLDVRTSPLVHGFYNEPPLPIYWLAVALDMLNPPRDCPRGRVCSMRMERLEWDMSLSQRANMQLNEQNCYWYLEMLCLNAN